MTETEEVDEWQILYNDVDREVVSETEYGQVVETTHYEIHKNIHTGEERRKDYDTFSQWEWNEEIKERIQSRWEESNLE